MYLPVVVRVDILKRLLVEFKSLYRTGEDGPFLFVEFYKVSDVRTATDFYSGHTAHIRIVPIVTHE